MMYKVIVYFSLVVTGCGAAGQSTADDEINPIFYYIRSDSVFYMAQAATTEQNQVADIVTDEGGEANAEQGGEQVDAGDASQKNIGSRLAVPATIAAAIIFSILVSGL